MNRRSEGVIATFNNDGTFNSIKIKEDRTDTLAKGTYELAEEGKFIISHETGKNKSDKVEIIEITDKFLKLKSPKENDIVILKRIQ